MILDNIIRGLYPNVVSTSIKTDGTYSATDASGNDIVLDATLIDAEYNANQYARDRATQYAPLADQLDMLWHAIDQGIDLKQSDFYTGNKAVKDAHPKG